MRRPGPALVGGVVLLLFGLQGASGWTAPPSKKNRTTASRSKDDPSEELKLPEWKARAELLDAPPKPSRWIEDARELGTYLAQAQGALRVALAEQEVAKGEARQALGGLLPQIDASSRPQWDSEQSSARVSGAGTIVENNSRSSLLNQLWVTQPLFGPSRYVAWKASETRVEASALEVRMAENQQTQRILLAVLEVQNAHAASVLTRGSYKESLERVAFAQKKVEAGDGTVLDLLRMQQDAESARANLVSSDEALRRSYERLGLALGVMDSVSLKTMNLDLNAMVHGACKRRGTGTERPDVEAAKKRLEAAQERLRSVRWALAPTLDVSGYLSQFVAGNESSLGVSVFGLLSVPIFDGGAIYGRRRAAEGQEAQALAQWETLRREATFSRQSAERDVESSERVREARQSGKVLALAAEEMARSTHASGWVTTFELITAAAQRRQAEREWLQAEFDTQRAKIVEWVSASTCTWE